MLKFRKEESRLILIYSSDYTGSNWIFERLDERDYVNLGNTFKVRQENLVNARPDVLDDSTQNDDIEFVIAFLVSEYFQFNKVVMGIDNSLYIHRSIPLERRTFIAERNISIFSKIDTLSNEDVYIGGSNENAIPADELAFILQNFPNSTELTKYAAARVGAVLTNYIGLNKNYQSDYSRYLNSKPSKKGEDLLNRFAELEAIRYEAVLEKLELMLSDEDAYTEKQWQVEILQIILLLYPKYIHAFTEAPVRDTYNSKNRSIDFLLIDATGNTDIIEIKKPFKQCIVTKRTYRDNYIPLRELSGTVMQIEKYIFYLNKWGKKGEDTLTAKYATKLASGFSIKITNPSGIIIMGRENTLTVEQIQDFEVIKRKYKNVIDIVTYDDLLSRLKLLLSHWRARA